MMALDRQSIDVEVDYSNTIVLYDTENQDRAIKAGMTFRAQGRKIELIRKSHRKTVEDYLEYAKREHFSGLMYFGASGRTVAYDLLAGTETEL